MAFATSKEIWLFKYLFVRGLFAFVIAEDICPIAISPEFSIEVRHFHKNFTKKFLARF